MTRQEVILIDASETAAYRAAGWQVKPLGGHHGHYSWLAVRRC